MADEIGESDLAGRRLLRVGGRARWAPVAEASRRYFGGSVQAVRGGSVQAVVDTKVQITPPGSMAALRVAHVDPVGLDRQRGARRHQQVAGPPSEVRGDGLPVARSLARQRRLALSVFEVGQRA